MYFVEKQVDGSCDGGGFVGWSLLRSAAIGLAGGIVAAILVNVVTAGPAPCLQSAKGWTILVAYKICQ